MSIIRAIIILATLARFRMDRNLPAHTRSWWVSILLFPLRLIRPDGTASESTRLALEALGPIFIKFGQLLSTRRDLFPEEMSDELQKLQDQVPPFDPRQARQIIEEDTGAPVDQVFESFSAEPMASASVAQVHAAVLTTEQGPQEVVIKVIRPGIDAVIRRDIRLMYLGARMLERFWPDAKRLHPVAIVKDYEQTILDELDLAREAANTRKLRDNWYGSGKLYVPVVFEALSSSRVMVMERIYGVTATDLASLEAEHTDLKKLAHLGVEIFFTQVFEDNFFHADMHPGNVFVDITDPTDPTYIALDCAIVGSLTENDQSYLAKNLLAFFRRDYDEVARLHVQSGWVPSATDVEEFSRVIRQVVDPYFQKPIREISFGTVLLELFQTARKFNMEVQPQLVLLQKTLINIEGMGRQIYPDLDLWETAAPFMERWMNERIGVAGLIRRISENAPRWLDRLPEIPDLAFNTMVEIRQLTEQNRCQAETLSEVNRALEKQAHRSRYRRLGGIALIGALLSMLLPATGYPAGIDPVVSGSVLGTLGIYWLYIHS